MMSRYPIVFFVPCLLYGLLMPLHAAGAEPERKWHAYWLTDGANAETGYQRLLISRRTLEQLAVAGEPATIFTSKAAPPILDASAVWIETHRKRALWNSDGQPIKIPPLIQNYRGEEQKVLVGDVEYTVEPAPVEIGIELLKNPNGPGGLHRLLPPLAGMEYTAKALLALLEAETGGTGSPQPAERGTEWQASVLTGGELAAGGYRWLLLSQVSLQMLASADTPASPQPGHEAPAVWVLTYGRDKEWTAVEPLAVPPPITNFQRENQTVSVRGVEYQVESVPVSETISLLRNGPFDPEKRLRSSVGALETRNRTARALRAFVESAVQTGEAALAPTRLQVGSTFAEEWSVTTSRIAEPDLRSGTLHGLQLVLGPEKRLRELAVYDNGFLERRETYIEDGVALVHEEFRREAIPGGRGGNGYRRVDSRRMPGSPPATLAEGYLLDGKPWHGRFVIVETIPGRNAFESDVRLVCREYSEGKVSASRADVTLGFGEREKEQAWLKALPSVLRDQ